MAGTTQELEYDDLYEVQVHCDYGADESFEFETEDEARRFFNDKIGKPDVRRLYLFGPDATDEWAI